MKLKDNDPFGGMAEFQQSFVDAEKFYLSGEYAPIDPVPFFSKLAAVSIPRGYFKVEIEEINKTEFFFMLSIRPLIGELPVGKSGQYTSVKIEKTNGDKRFESTYAAYFSNYPSKDIWRLLVPSNQDSSYFKTLKKGDLIKVSRPFSDFGYNPLRDPYDVAALARQSSIAPFISLADGIAKGKYDFSLAINVLLPLDKEVKALLEDTARGCNKIKVLYLNDVSELDVSANDALFIAYSSEEKDLSSLHVSCSVRKLCTFVPSSKALGEVVSVKVSNFDGEYLLSACKGEKLIDVLERSEVKTESRCRNGECGYCRVKLIEGNVEITGAKTRAADDIFGYIHACCAYLSEDVQIAIDY